MVIIFRSSPNLIKKKHGRYGEGKIQSDPIRLHPYVQDL
jgi:hypothetical protein